MPPSVAKSELNLTLGARPVVAAGDALTTGNHLHQGGLTQNSWLPRSGWWCWCPIASLVRPPQSCVCRSHPITAVSWVDVAEVTAVELGPALSVPIGVEMAVASARPSLSPSWSQSIFPTAYRPVTVLTLSRGAAATASKRVGEAGTLGFTSPAIMVTSVEV